MSENESALYDSGGATWNLPAGEGARQAIPALRGYAYQLHQSLAAWIALPPGASLYLEAAEDYATIANTPSTLERVLLANQVKDTRESGAVTLNSADIIDAIGRLWALQEANPDRPVQMTFLTTSPIGKERLKRLANGRPGLEEWRGAARGGPVEAIRRALAARFKDGHLARFIADSDDEALRERLLRPLTWSCGAPALQGIEADNRSALIELGHELQSTPDMSARAADVLLSRVLTAIVRPGSSRRLTRGDLLEAFHEAVSLRLPAQAVAGAMVAASARGVLSLAETGAWHDPSILAIGPRASRTEAVGALFPLLQANGALWIHGATGLGKSVLAELLAKAQGGSWRFLDLRGAPAGGAAERVVAAAGAIGAIPDFNGLIIDDISAEMEDLDTPLQRLGVALERRDAFCIVTSHNPPGRRLARALGVSGDAVALAPAFSEEDAAALIVEYGGDPTQWTRFVWIVGGGGHPLLVDVVVAGLASRGWPADAMEKWIETGFQSDDVEAEREAARRRLLQELSDQSRQFLCRTTRISGPFDRQLALAVGRVPPALQDGAASLDRLSGHWIEGLGSNRLRASPLVGGLAGQMLPADELALLDREIATHILARGNVDADLVDTAFVHAVMARAIDLINAIACNVIGLEGGEKRTALASAMPVFRIGSSDPGGILAANPNVEVMVRLAQHYLTAALDDTDEIARSSTKVIERLDAVPDLEARGHLEVMVLSKILVDQFAFGKIPNWFGLVDRFEVACERSSSVAEITAGMHADGGPDPVDLAFVAHAIELPRLSDLEALFGHLDSLGAEARTRRLAPLRTDPTALSLAVDSPWLKQSRVEVLDGTSLAAVYDRLARMALSWQEPSVAAQCFRAQAIMLDEYAVDARAALAGLDAADAILPDHLVLKRERAKIAWRAKDYASALEQLSAIADRLEASEPLETAFALREAAISASELGRWDDAWRFFERARTAAVAAAKRPTPFNVGLAGDAAAARFASGDQAAAVRDMRLALESLDGVPPTEGSKAHYCHLVLRHIVLWMHAAYADDLRVEGEPVIYVPGSASNPDPLPDLESRPLGALQAAWMMLSNVALSIGVAAEEVLGWPGVADLQNYAVFDVNLRMDLLGAAIRAGSIEGFRTYAPPAVEAMCYLSSQSWRDNPPDVVVAPQRAVIPAVVRDGPSSINALKHWRDAGLAMACGLVFPAPTFGAGRLDVLHGLIVDLAGADVIPEWVDGATSDPDDLSSTVAGLICQLANCDLAGVDEIYGAELRFAEWTPKTNYGRVVGVLLADRVRADWSDIIDKRAAFLRHPMLSIPAIREALAAPRKGLDYVVNVLLAAEPATRLDLSDEFRAALRKRLGNSL